AACAHFAGREDDFGDWGYLGNTISTVVVLFAMSRDTRRYRLLGAWSVAPMLVAWSLVLAIPIGAILEGIDERYLEIALLGVAGAWTVLGLGALATIPRPSSSTQQG
ncbi:MAG: hypothetical protein ACR2N7_12595, partial [Acidimicrobiia bacterium]